MPTYDAVDNVSLDLVSRLKFFESIPRTVESEFWLLSHQAQLSVDVVTFLIITQSMPSSVTLLTLPDLL